MNKRVIIFLSAILGTVFVLILGLYFLLFGNQATTPDAIAKRVGLKLPAYQIVYAEDNMDRTASAWSYYSYEIKFKEPLSEAYLRKVEKLKNCIREGDTYIVSDESPDNWSGKILIYPTDNRAAMEYEFRDALF